MNVNPYMLNYISVPEISFDKVIPEWPSAQRIEETAKALDEKVKKYMYTDAYAYHPQNMSRVHPHRLGKNVDFIVA